MSGNIIEANAKNIRIKFLLGFLFGFVLVLSLIQSGFAMANPAAIYCKEMNKEFSGYEYKTKNNANGNQNGICAVDGKEFNDWDFYKGKVGKEYSYCEKKGFRSEVVDSKIVCLTGKSKKPKIFVEEALNIEEKSVTSIVSFRGALTSSTSGAKIISGESQLLKLSADKILSLAPLTFYNQTNYSFWDWRTPPNTTSWGNISHRLLDNSFGWMTSVKNQGGCGSCWAFGINGAVESKYEINNNNSRLNPDLSEQSSVSCDHSCYAGHSPPDLTNCNSGCDGGWLDLSLNFLKNNGTVDDACFTYIDDDGDCANRCSNYQNRTWTIGNADYSSWWTDFTQEELEQWILDYGPVPIAIHMETSIDGNGFIDCGVGEASNHAVVLVGYNDTGTDSTSYWILKNSWGTGSGINGYFYIKFNDDCNVGDEVYYLNTTTAPEFKLNVSLISPEIDTTSSNRTQVISFMTGNKLYKNSTCDLIISNALNQTNSSVANSTITSFRVDSLSDGNYNFSIRCWENKLAIINNSITRNIFISGNTISTTLVSPSTNFFSNIDSRNFTCRSISGTSYSLTNTTFYLWNSTSQIYNETGYFINGTVNESKFNYTFSLEDSYSWNCLSRNNNSNVSFADGNYSFTYDTTSPNISLNSLADGYSETASSSILTFNYNASDLNNVSNCSLIVGGAVNSVNTTLNSTSITATFSAGSYSWSINCSDYAGNIGNSSSRSFTITAPPATCTNCGGGGGSGSSTHIYSLSENQIVLGYNQELGKDDKIKISSRGRITNFKENHTITVSAVGSAYTSLVVSSEPLSIILLISEEKKLSLENLEYYELLLKLNSISGDKANLTVRAIYEKIMSSSSLTLNSQFEETTNTEQTESRINEGSIIGTGDSGNAKIYIYTIFICIAVVLAYFFAGRLFDTKKIKQKNKVRKTA